MAYDICGLERVMEERKTGLVHLRVVAWFRFVPADRRHPNRQPRVRNNKYRDLRIRIYERRWRHTW